MRVYAKNIQMSDLKDKSRTELWNLIKRERAKLEKLKADIQAEKKLGAKNNSKIKDIIERSKTVNFNLTKLIHEAEKRVSK